MKYFLDRKKTVLLCFGFLFFGYTVGSWAKLSDLTLEGVIVAYDKKTVTLSHRGKRVKVSRKAIPKGIKLKTGKLVKARMSSKAFIKRLRAQESAKKQK